MRLRTLLLLCAFGLAAGCANRDGCLACESLPTAISIPYPCDPSSIAAATLATNVDFLFLSGGGSYGAYGAGVLYGWSQALSPNDRKPFTLVTGISTGALQATYAFLGPVYDGYLYKNYTDPPPDLMPRRPWWQLLFSSSVNTTKGLQQVLEDTVPDSMIDAVGAQQGQRMLCVGTTNLDTGEFVHWDMTQIAKQADYDLYRKVLLASASVPAASPPVELIGALHGDGGVRNQIFSVDLLSGVMNRAVGASNRAFFLVNDYLSVRADCTKPRILPLAERTIAILMAQGLSQSLWTAEAKIAGTGNGFSTEYLYIPNDYPVGFTSDKFDKDLMCRLFCRGMFDGRSFGWHGNQPGDLGPRSCDSPPFPTGDLLSDSFCPDTGPPQCPPTYN